jgi:hypothetical protein
MKPRSLTVFGLAAAAAVGCVVWWAMPGPRAEDPDDGPVVLDEDGAPIDAREHARRLRADRQAQARNLAFDERDRDSSVLQGQGGALEAGTAIDRKAAEEGFDHVMRVLEDTAHDRERLAKSDWRELYRAANDAYSALSMHLDANDPEQRDELEAAHRRLQDGLRRVRVRGRKFGPE